MSEDEDEGDEEEEDVDDELRNSDVPSLVKTHCVAMRLPKKRKKERKEGTKKR